MGEEFEKKKSKMWNNKLNVENLTINWLNITKKENKNKKDWDVNSKKALS